MRGRPLWRAFFRRIFSVIMSEYVQRMRTYFSAALILAVFLVTRVSYAQDYTVGQNDILRITVYDHADLATTARVSGEGLISFPLIGSVKVAGLTTTQVAAEISSRLADGYIVDPHVSVFVQEYQSKKATLLGQVEKPGIYVLSGDTTFLQLLSQAGGLTPDAGDRAVLTRKSLLPGKEDSVIAIDLQRLVAGGDTSLDVAVRDGDNIYVPKAGVFFITGEVKKPDAYKYEEGVTVIKAITTAGGLTDKASSGRIRIIRKVGGKEQVIDKAGMDAPVMKNDIIVVPESYF
jgi:polysaccharide export outer membrane protein